jgi:D-glycero-D-manno-heptose 1,7-bisphosphate phosphatase
MGVGREVSQRAVFLDRDGVINRAVIRDGKPYPPSSLAELEILSSVPDALLRLKRAGYLLIVVSNQPDVARGTTTQAQVEAINTRLREELPIDEFRMCFHDGHENCSCRKPKPGMLLEAAAKWNVDLGKSFMVGDRWRDIDAANAAGCTAFFIDYGYNERVPAGPFHRVHSLGDAADLILNAKDNL